MSSHDIVHLVVFIIIAIGVPFAGALLIDYAAKRFNNLK